MKKQIWKFPLETTDIQSVEMPVDAEILSLQTQNETPCIWALVSPDAPKKDFKFEIFGTGQNIQNGNRKYVGTYQLRGGSLVFHCFQVLQ